MDGVRHDAPFAEDLPGFRRLAETGSRAAALVPVFPSSTFPNHVSLATGARTDRHGIVGNRFYDRSRGEFDYDNDASWFQAEPLWAAVERQAVRAATYFWVGSETDWRGIGATFREAPFDSAVGEDDKVEKILGWLDLPEIERPGLIMSWWHGTDHAGHRHGATAPATHDALVEQDRHLIALLEGIDRRQAWPFTTLYVVSDHGMLDTTEVVDPAAALRRSGFFAEVSYGMAVAHAFSPSPEVRSGVLQVWNRLPHVTAYRQKDLPVGLRFGHPERVGDVVGLIEPPGRFAPQKAWQRGAARLLSWMGKPTGAHGYDPQKFPEMNGIWFAAGRGIAPGRTGPTARVIDVAASAARLLGLSPPRHSEGSALELFDGRADAKLTAPTAAEPRP